MRRIHLVSGAAALCLTVGAVTAVCVTPAMATPSAPAHAVAAPHAVTATTFPGAVFAPYVDTGFSSVNGALPGSTLSTIASSYGVKYFSLAFVNGSGCTWSLFNSSQYQGEVQQLKSAGGNVFVSFGGYNADTNGTDLGNQCSSASAMAAQIEGVVNYFNPGGLDFDIESNELTNSTDVNRTNQALAMVRSWANGAGHSSMAIDYTIPVFTSGLTSPGMALLHNGVSNGFRPNIVNVMAFDFGSSGTEMGQAAEQGLSSSASQVGSVYGGNGMSMTGLTVMPGQNDSAGEVFTLADASSVESYAASHGSPLLTFWSEGRDNGGCPGTTGASSTCSGVSQSTGKFSQIFKAFTNGSGGGGGGGGGGGSEYVSAASGRCLDDPNSSRTAGTIMDIWGCHHGQNQEWTYTGSRQLTVFGLCLDARGQGRTAGTLVDLWTCNGQANQQWNVNSNGTITGVQSGLCLDVHGGGNSPNGTQIDIWTCNGGTNQKWSKA